MNFDIKKFRKENFKIKPYSGHDTFFVSASTGEKSCVYLHRDETLHDFCGDPNFYDTIAEAQALLDRVFVNENILDEELFKI